MRWNAVSYSNGTSTNWSMSKLGILLAALANTTWSGTTNSMWMAIVFRSAIVSEVVSIIWARNISQPQLNAFCCPVVKLKIWNFLTSTVYKSFQNLNPLIWALNWRQCLNMKAYSILYEILSLLKSIIANIIKKFDYSFIKCRILYMLEEIRKHIFRLWCEKISSWLRSIICYQSF